MSQNYWKQVDQMVSKAQDHLILRDCTVLEFRQTSSEAITMKCQLLFQSWIISISFSLPIKSFRSKPLANELKEKQRKKKKKSNDTQCQVSSQSAHPHFVDTPSAPAVTQLNSTEHRCSKEQLTQKHTSLQGS